MIFISQSYDFKGRTIVQVRLPNGEKQPFYRSSGNSSGMKGTWFPFDGPSTNDGWFIKTRFVHQGGIKYGGWHRYGSAALFVVSELLATLDIPEGRELCKPEEVNLFLWGAETAPFLTDKPYDDVEAVVNSYEIQTGQSIGKPELRGQVPMLATTP